MYVEWRKGLEDRSAFFVVGLPCVPLHGTRHAKPNGRRSAPHSCPAYRPIGYICLVLGMRHMAKGLICRVFCLMRTVKRNFAMCVSLLRRVFPILRTQGACVLLIFRHTANYEFSIGNVSMCLAD